ncbi:MAG: trypsin-like peptidase domain-containing protein [Candidatus Aminicenantes bacterium]
MTGNYFSCKIRHMGMALLVLVLVLGQVKGLAEIIVLKGGSQVKGTILKRDLSIVVVDLGFDVLSIPQNEILEIRKEKNISEKAPTSFKDNQGVLYTAKPLIEKSTVEGVSSFAPAVVVVRSPAGLGSGFLINKSGYLVTNFHVIMGQKHITVTQFKKSGAELNRIIHKNVRIVALDPFHDLAVLQVKGKLDEPFRPIVFSPEEKSRVGEKVFVIGNPLGLERSVTEGVVSHTARNFGGRLYLQVDASVNPGNSGGPLFNSRGEAIGVINMGVRSMQGLNFAIPIRHVKYILDHIDAFAYNETNPLSGYVYSPPPPNPQKKKKSTGKEEERNE